VEIILLKIIPSLQTAAAVSSQDDSIARIVAIRQRKCLKIGRILGQRYGMPV
jgi:hypothetical protein